MRRTLRVLPDAEAELQSAAVWYEGKRRGLGVEFAASLITPSWNQVVGFLTDWEGLRRMAA